MILIIIFIYDIMLGNGGGVMQVHQAPYQLLQRLIDQLLRDLYHIPVHMRTTAKVLELIHARQDEWKKVDHFRSGCDFIALARVIDHFLQEMRVHQDPSVWFCDTWQSYDPEESRAFHLKRVIIQQEGEYVAFKKFFVECSPEDIQRYHQSARICSLHMFSKEPRVIEYVNLTTGEKNVLRSA